MCKIFDLRHFYSLYKKLSFQTRKCRRVKRNSKNDDMKHILLFLIVAVICVAMVVLVLGEHTGGDNDDYWEW